MHKQCYYLKDCATCTSTIVDKEKRENCYWNSSEEKCSSFQEDGYSSTCGDSYINKLSKFANSANYAGKNVITIDGKKAYITESGVAKLYDDTDASVFAGTAGLRGCPTTIEQLNQAWDKLGFPMGSAMTKGQTCGNETKYVTAEPPENKFDAQWYRTTYPQLKLTTDEEALYNWKTVGQQAGRLPNPTIMKSMANLGTVGYIDAETVMHGVKDFTYSGLKSFLQRSNVKGKNMVDCTSLKNLAYGTSVILASQNKTAYLTTDNNMMFDTTQEHTLILRPPPDATLSNGAIKFGDTVSLATSMQNSTVNCGYYGCKVGNIDANSWKFTFAPGGTTGGTMLTIMPPSTGYVEGDSVSYGTPFVLMAILPIPNNAMYQSDKMVPGDRLPSADDRYYFTYRQDGYVVLYKNPSTEIWKSEVGSTNPKMVQISATGNLRAINTDGVTYWSSTNAEGTTPFALAMQTDGRLVMFDAMLKEVWTQGRGDGTVQNLQQRLYAQVSTTSELVFTDNLAKQSVFSFLDTDPARRDADDSCDVTEMHANCKDDCVGFIHDPKAHEWQQIKINMQPDNFEITTTLQDMYMKVPKVTLKDKSCKKENAMFVDEVNFYGYPLGNDLDTEGTKQCGPVDLSLDEEEMAYNERNAQQANEAVNSAFDYDTSPLQGIQAGTKGRQKENSQKMQELEAVMKEIQENPDNETYKQQVIDSNILDEQAKIRSIFWLILAVATAGFIAVAWFGGVMAAIIALAVGGVLYLGYRFFH